MQIELSHQALATVKLALMGWTERCKAEARMMDEFAEQFPDSAEKCRANAAASRHFIDEAEAVLAQLRALHGPVA